MPSARPAPSRRLPRLALLGICGLLLLAVPAGCSTTQEKAQIQQARAKHILAARAERQKQKHRHDKHKDGGN